MRFYWNGKRYVPSATTVLPKPDLARWAAKCAVEYVVDAVANNTPILFNEARTAFERESMQAADYGTYIHAMCRYSLENDIELESPHEMTSDFMKGLWKWKTKRNVKVIAMEHEVITDTYGGTLDLVCEMDGEMRGVRMRTVTLVDFKTGKGSYYETWKYQLAGYRQAWNRNLCVCCDGSDLGTCADDHPHGIQSHGILKFNKEKTKTKGYSTNYKDFNEYGATRPCLTGERVNGKVPTEKYTRNWQLDTLMFNAWVRVWWLGNRGIDVT